MIALVAPACKRRQPEPPPRLPEPIPADYPLPEGETLEDEVRLGRRATFVFSYSRPGAEILDKLAATLAEKSWPVVRAGGKVTTSRGERSFVASAEGQTVTIDAIEAAPPADARPPRPPPLTKPPPGWPPRFPFIPGGIPETIPGAPAGAIGLWYPEKTAKALAAAIRAQAQRRQWMCTQEPLEFVCAGAGSVDLRIRDRKDGVVLLVIF